MCDYCGYDPCHYGEECARNMGLVKRYDKDGRGESGRESISSVQDLVAKLITQSDSLLEANSVIDNIASQTNLLAMNAAIEAAHAGEAGKLQANRVATIDLTR